MSFWWETPSTATCRLCGDPTRNGGEHPCCVYWITQQGHTRCAACAESKKAARERKRKGQAPFNRTRSHQTATDGPTGSPDNPEGSTPCSDT